MGIFPKNENEGFLFTPKEGATTPLVVTIVGEMKRVQSTNPESNYKKKGNIDCGYYDVLPVISEETGQEANLKISTWAVYFEFKKHEELNIGDTIAIAHPSKGVYTITKQ